MLLVAWRRELLPALQEVRLRLELGVLLVRVLLLVMELRVLMMLVMVVVGWLLRIVAKLVFGL